MTDLTAFVELVVVEAEAAVGPDRHMD
jgi:hypothetical protein